MHITGQWNNLSSAIKRVDNITASQQQVVKANNHSIPPCIPNHKTPEIITWCPSGRYHNKSFLWASDVIRHFYYMLSQVLITKTMNCCLLYYDTVCTNAVDSYSPFSQTKSVKWNNVNDVNGTYIYWYCVISVMTCLYGKCTWPQKWIVSYSVLSNSSNETQQLDSTVAEWCIRHKSDILSDIFQAISWAKFTPHFRNRLPRGRSKWRMNPLCPIDAI